jgi:hypothetical protein
MFMPYKLPPLHFALKGTNSIPNITDIENSSRDEYHTNYHSGEKKQGYTE